MVFCAPAAYHDARIPAPYTAVHDETKFRIQATGKTQQMSPFAANIRTCLQQYITDKDIHAKALAQVHNCIAREIDCCSSDREQVFASNASANN